MQPLADKLRPKDIDDMVGQHHIIGKGKIINKLLANNTIPNMILYGPPGTGKTTLANIIAKYTSNVFCTTYGDFLNSKGKVGNPYDLNGRINLYYDSLGNVSVNNSANNIVLKDSVWFNKIGDIYKTVDPNKPNRTWPEGKSMYSDPLPLHA